MTVADSPVVDAMVLDAAGQPIGGAVVFAYDGYLSNLEIYAWDGEQITQLPSPDRLC
ncbi:hypothetical protein [Streptomyces melanogenes]|uniref:hypothetical protein n=1 Tax=Streptomyces melanogenes TaxID=67326 RepID=UPI00379DA91E